MFASMDLAFDLKYCLRCRNFYIVNKRVTEMREGGPEGGSTNRGEQGAARSAMQVQAQIGPESPYGGCLRVEERIDIRVALENRTAPRLDYDSQPEIWTRAFEQVQRRRRE